MAVLQIALLAVLVFIVLYGTSRASGYLADLLRRPGQNSNASDSSPQNGVKTAKYGTHFHHS